MEVDVTGRESSGQDTSWSGKEPLIEGEEKSGRCCSWDIVYGHCGKAADRDRGASLGIFKLRG